MRRLLFSRLRARLLALVLLAIVPALALMLYTAGEDRRLAVADARSDVLHVARLAAANEDDLIEGARQLLVALAQLPPVRERNPAACRALFAETLKQYPHYSKLIAVTPEGDVFCSALPTSGPVNVADRACFRRALAERRFAIGDYQSSRVTGKTIVAFAYPRNRGAPRRTHLGGLTAR